MHAHLRAFDTSSRQNDAAELAQGVFDTVDGDERGRKAAIEAAQALGFDVELSRSTALFSACGPTRAGPSLRYLSPTGTRWCASRPPG